MTRPPRVVWLGLAVVLVAAAVLSFDALRGLALAVAIPPHLAWLLPVAVDAGAAVSCATWLGGRTRPDAARFAGGLTWALLAVTVVGNAGQLGMHAHGVVPPWWVAVAVGSIPPAVVGATVHLVVLLVRRSESPTLAATGRTVGDSLGGGEGSSTTRHIGPEDGPAPEPVTPVLTAPVTVPVTAEHASEYAEPEHDIDPERAGPPARTGSDDEIREYLREHGLPSRRQLTKELICGTTRYNRLLAEARELAPLRRVQ